MQKNTYKKMGINTVMLYLLTAAKIVFPLITLPYLTRVLSVEGYGVVSYVKSIIIYVQLTIDFGFIYSSVKDIVEANGDRNIISKIVSNTVVAKLILSTFTFLVVIILAFSVPLLREYKLFLVLSFIPPFLSSFLLDFFYRGIEKMHIVSLIFVSMKTISTILTLCFIKSDTQILLIPIFDALGSLFAIVLTGIIAKKLGVTLKLDSIKYAFSQLRKSFFYFTNSMASTAFGALNTVIIGIFIVDLKIIAYWSVCIQLIGAVQSLYKPISNSIYPYMIKNKDMRLIKKVLFVLMPLILVGSAACYLFSPWILTVMSGEQYAEAANIFRILLPVLVISFPVEILALPSLGAIGKIKQVNIATIFGAVTQILGLLILIVIQQFTVFNIAVLRNLSELVMFIVLLSFLIKYKNLFNDLEKEKRWNK